MFFFSFYRWKPLESMKHIPSFTASKYMEQVEAILREEEEDEYREEPPPEVIYSSHLLYSFRTIN